jgi:hypothetical protein
VIASSKPAFLLLLIALGVVIGVTKLSYGLHRHRLPDFTLDVDPSDSSSLRFRFSRDGTKATLTTIIYENQAGRRGREISTFSQDVSAADIAGLTASMQKVSFFESIDDSDVRDGTAWSLRLDRFPFASLSSRTLSGLPGLQEVGLRLLAISRSLREERGGPRNPAP